jgi:hypothetical protein
MSQSKARQEVTMMNTFYSKLRQLFATREARTLTRAEKKQRRKEAVRKPGRLRQLRV